MTTAFDAAGEGSARACWALMRRARADRFESASSTAKPSPFQMVALPRSKKPDTYWSAPRHAKRPVISTTEIRYVRRSELTEPVMKHNLRQRLRQPRLVSAPGVYDMISLRIADRMGFELLYMTGYGAVASLLGLPDAGLATYSDMLGRVSAMAAMAKTPLIADGDTGYGGLLNVRQTVRGYEAAGAAGIQLED